MFAPIRLVRGGWPRVLERPLARFFRDDPREVFAGRGDPAAFRRAMSLLHVGQTIKITGLGRHREADDLLIRHVDTAGKAVLDLGASDGSTSVELVRRLPDFGSFVIADLYLAASTADTGRHTAVFDPDGACVLVAGRRFVAWPTLSRAVRVLYWPVLGALAAGALPRRELTLLNPETQAVISADDRVSSAVHDVFRPWTGTPAPDVIKVANVLRRLYFSDDDIARALRALHASLAEGGHLLIIDNPRYAGSTVAGGLYRRTADGFELVDQTAHPAEIDDLIRRTSVTA